jgi:hypothetical protein
MNAYYTCDMSAYGGTSPVDMTAVITAPTSVTAGTSAYLSFATDVITLPSSVSSNPTMQSVTGVSFSGTTTVGDEGTDTNVDLKSFTAPAILDQPTEIPATLPNTTTVTLTKAGTAYVPEPVTVTITPYNVQGTSLTPIVCSLPTAGIPDLSITVTAPPATSPGPVYSCAISFDGQSLGTETAPIPMSISESGSRTTGTTDEITLSSPGTGLGGPYPSGSTAVAFSGSLPVTGAQQGSVTLSRRTTDVTSSTFTVTGQLALTEPGTDSIRVPKSFTFSLYGPSGEPPVVLSCKSQSSTPEIGLTMDVTGQAVPEPATSGSASPVPSATGTPVGAPNTGGGRPASGLPLVAGGAALLALGGAGLAIAARRRRQGQSIGLWQDGTDASQGRGPSSRY